ncbi:DUF4937 domain-containing protein [Cytobacillus sp. FJAT-54145]|uniref:DUF4937 domain-containing protein n=1 Tax=Cytobacillus spartinae TaxID=3299023 RepID=A0ABW6KJF6_9BACI
MLIKRITCTVDKSQKEHFHKAQIDWGKLSAVPGFVCQIGGWKVDKAHIIALWENKDAYRHFMDAIHDEIFHDSKQEKTYRSIEVSILDEELNFSQAIRALQEEGITIVHEWTVKGENQSISL